VFRNLYQKIVLILFTLWKLTLCVCLQKLPCFSTIFHREVRLFTFTHIRVCRDVVEAQTSRPSLHQKNLSLEIWSSRPRLDTWNFVDYAEIFLNIFKKMSSPLRSSNFAKFWHFSYLLLLFLTCGYSRQKHIELQKLAWAISLQ